MNYQHAFHAGNFADVLKHVVLIAVIKALKKKPKPITYIETHAGAGRYVLADASESSAGVMRLFAHGLDPMLLDYVKRSVVDSKYYLGSPLITRSLLENTDRMILAESEPNVAAHLQQHFAHDHLAKIHVQDGYSLLKASLPPTPARGLVLIDPPFEDAQEFSKIERALQDALSRWSTGVYAVWYPIKLRAHSDRFIRRLAALPCKRVVTIELCVAPDNSELSLNGCGMALLNPPYGIELELEQAVQQLLPMLQRATGVRAGVRVVREE
jgi:23S rRNA (adenine2030-N6)-methyltransferase